LVTMRLVVLLFLIGLLVKVLKSSQDTHPILITFFPAVVFITTYVQSRLLLNKSTAGTISAKAAIADKGTSQFFMFLGS